jgi:hypothetical protein
MMKQRAFGWAAFGVFAIIVGGCDSGRHDHDGSTLNSEAYNEQMCGAYTTCGTCTPVVGCGWCGEGASGMCTASPDECTGQTFDWTWDPNGCRVEADASVVSTSDAGTTDAATEDASENEDASALR